MRTTKGYLFTRGKKKHYHLGYYVDGKQFREKLFDEEGKPITRRPQAEIAAQKILEPVTAKNQAERLKKVMEQVETAEMKLERAEKAAREREDAERARLEDKKALKIKDAWEVYTDPAKRLMPECGADNLKNYGGYWRIFCKWLAENSKDIIFMRDISENHTKAFAGYIEQIKSGNTFNKYRAFLFSFFKALQPYSRAEINPFECIKRKEKVKANRKRNLTKEELVRVIDTVPEDLRLLFWLGISTGLRLGDVATLKWNDVVLEKRLIRRTTNKTGSETIAAILPVAFEILAETPVEDRTGYLMPAIAAAYTDKKKQPHFCARVMDVFRKAGIETTKEGTGEGTGKRAVVSVGFHSLRHTFTSICAERGLTLTETQNILGHSTGAQTLYYTHTAESTAVKAGKELMTYLVDAEVIEDPPALPSPEDSLRQQITEKLAAMNENRLRNVLQFISNVNF